MSTFRRQFIRPDGTVERTATFTGRVVKRGMECVCLAGDSSGYLHIGTHRHPDGSLMVTTEVAD